MCFHNALSVDAQKIEMRFDASFDAGKTFQPIYHANAFSHIDWPVITLESPQKINDYSWGLIPFWGKNLKQAREIRTKTFNARAETIFEKPSFQNSVKTQRCLVLSSGFFEWHHKGTRKYPYFISMKNNDLFAMGGIYSSWKEPSSKREIHTFSIITTQANSLMGFIHNTKKRMPLILKRSQEEIWLKSDLTTDEITTMLQPLPSDCLAAYTVTPHILKAGYNSNRPDTQKPYIYPELDNNAGLLF